MNKLLSLLSARRIMGCQNSFGSRVNRLSADGKEIPKVKSFQNRITLISVDNSVTITDLKNAQNLSSKRELKLVKIQDVDAKTRRPVYKLMTNSEYHEEELQRRKDRQESKQNSSTKGDKLLSLNTRIGEHDLMSNVKKIIKLLEKQYEVKIIINGEGTGDTQQLERLYSVIEQNIKNVGSVAQKRNKGNSLRFQLLPCRNQSTDKSPGSDKPSNSGSDDDGPL